MSDSTANPPSASPAAAPTQAAPVPAQPPLDPVFVFFALGSEVRLPIVRMLADGRVLCISDVAGALGRDIDAIGKQLLVLRDAGLVTAAAGRDRRQTVYQIPAAFRVAPGILDFGCCRVDLAKL